MVRCLMVVILIVFSLPPAMNAQQFELVTPRILDLGEVSADSIARGVIKFRNAGDKELRIKKVQTSCGCTAAEMTKLNFAPGEEGELPVSFNTKGYSGLTRKTVTIFTEEGQPSSSRVVIQVKVVPQIDVEPRFLNFENVSLNDGEVKMNFTIANNMDEKISGEIKYNSEDHILIDPKKFSVDPHSEVEISVTFNPVESGRNDTYLTIGVTNPKRIFKRLPVFVNVKETGS